MITYIPGVGLMDPSKLASAFLIRSFEQKLLTLFSEGKLFGTVHTCIGQELTGVAVCGCLEEGDLVFTNHRGHGHFLARTGDVDGLMAEIMGRQTGVCGGRGGSQHICSGGVFSNGVQGGIVPVSAGLALAQQIRKSKNIVAAFIGDGTLGEGVIYEAFNLVSKWDIPLLITLENNLYAQSTSQTQTLAGSIRARAEAFGIHTAAADVWNPDCLCREAAAAVRYVRQNSRPFFLQVDAYRLMAHSKGDDNRDKEEVKEYWIRDPLVACDSAYPEAADAAKRAAETAVEAAVAKAEAAPLAGPSAAPGPETGELNWRRARPGPGDRLSARIYEGLRRSMELDERIFVLGEDVEGPYGGAFKVTRDLSSLYPGRVRNTPISEATIVGVGTGMAMAGMLPVCEIMFGDFLTLAGDQIINHAAKFAYMYNGKVSVPVVIRTPMGGRRGYGATHSQSLEKHFLGVPGTRVLAIHHRYDPALVYESLFETIDRPTLVIENKVLYGRPLSTQAPAGYQWEHTAEVFPCTRLRPGAAADLTLLCYGGMLEEAERAVDVLFDEHEIVAEIICPTQLYPLDLRPIMESVTQTCRLLVLEEGPGFCGFGAEAIAGLQERLDGESIRVARLSGPPHPVPSCKPLETLLLPGTDAIVQRAIEVVNGCPTM